MELSKLKIGDYIKHIETDSYFYLKKIERGLLIFQKFVEPHENPLVWGINEDVKFYEGYELVDKIPEKYIPF